MSASARVQDDRLVLAAQLHSLLLNDIGALIAQSQICEKSAVVGDGRTLQEVARLREMLRNLEDSARELIDITVTARGSSLSEALRLEVSKFQVKHPRVAVHSSFDAVAVIQANWLTSLVVGIVHEALANAARHGRPSQIEIVATPATEGLLIRIRDNGRGFDTRRVSDSEALRVPGHYGIRIMQDTAKSVEGRVEISSAPGKGTQVTLFVPLRARLSERLGASLGDHRLAKDNRQRG
jgi:signal transduction histidine kinase